MCLTEKELEIFIKHETSKWAKIKKDQVLFWVLRIHGVCNSSKNLSWTSLSSQVRQRSAGYNFGPYRSSGFHEVV